MTPILSRLLCASTLLATPLVAANQVDFAREILPILSDKCFACHGPDTKRKKDLRLDSYAAATSDRDGIRAIDPASPEDSETLIRIHDKKDPMPPDDAEKQLTDAERDLLSRWVRQGGAYADHWAFVPPVKTQAAKTGVIDTLIAAGHATHDTELTFAPEANRTTLARRASLVLTGLPPEPDQLAAFLADKSPGAYERFVDVLMNSPRYGEHQARYWLDAVRYVVMHAHTKFGEQSLFNRLWGPGFLPSEHQGVLLRSQGDPVLYLNNPQGVSRSDRRAQLDTLAALNNVQHERFADPDVLARIKQHEMAYRMQTSVPELMDLSGEGDATFELYGEEARQAGSFAACCLNARRLAERGVRNIQIFHRGWDAHNNLPKEHESQCKDIDQACAALIKDLKQRGMLDETLVVWGGEFGRTAYCQGKLTDQNYGRDHHPRCFTTWMAGGGVKPGITYGKTDDYGYNIVEANGDTMFPQPEKDKWTPGTMHIHDLNATILHLLGIDHRKLTYRYQGRDFRLTDIHGHVIQDLLA